MRSLAMGQAYDFTQYGPVHHGDVLLVSDGVAVLDRAWPVMVSGRSDVFHRLADGATWSEYLAELSADKAARLAAGLELAALPADQLAARAVTVAELDELDELDEPAGPSPDQLSAVAAYAARHGRAWRAALATAWLTGRDTAEPDGHLLRQVRNTYGPTWLATVTLADLAAARGAA
jgi:hypothetical protein